MTKREARRLAKARRAALDQAAIGSAMAKALTASAVWRGCDTVLCFASLPDEPDTAPIFSAAREEGKRLLLPRVAGESLEWVAVGETSSFAPGAYGIWEPQGEPVPPRGETLALIPCLAATKTGLRLGRGGGYYDRFLAQYKGDKLLLCPSALLFDVLPTDPWDIRFAPHEILTEKGILS